MAPRPLSSRLLVLLLLADAVRGGDDRRGVLARLGSRATDALTTVVDPDVIVEKVDVAALIERVDVDALLTRVDVDALMERVDVDALLARVDPNVLLDRVDVDALLDRVEPDRILDRVDVNRLMERVDIEALVERAGIPEIVRESTGHVAGSVLDVARRQVVGLDELIGRVLYRVTGRNPDQRPVAPPTLLDEAAVDARGRGLVAGHYAGPLSRLLAAIIDVGVVMAVYTLVAAGVTFVARFLFGVEQVDPVETGVVAAVALTAWAFLYVWVSTALTGRTAGKQVLGIKIVDRDGSTLRGRQAFGRTLAQPFSFLPFGLGLVGIVVSPTRRALHDVLAHTVVVYDWGNRPADMPAPLTAWLARHDVEAPLWRLSSASRQGSDDTGVGGGEQQGVVGGAEPEAGVGEQPDVTREDRQRAAGPTVAGVVGEGEPGGTTHHREGAAEVEVAEQATDRIDG